MIVGGKRRRASGRSVMAVSAVCVTAILAAGCATFDDSASSPFSPEPTEAVGGEVEPRNPPPTPDEIPPPTQLGPCEDPDPSVIATCLGTTGGLVVLPEGDTALVAERRTGRIMEVAEGQTPREIAHVDVDGSSDGGLLDIALSPTFVEDNLIYAYVTTPTDNRVVRIAPGDTAKEILGGIPRGATGNTGSLEFSGDDLMVLTGDAGNPAAAADPASLAGKLLKVTALSPASISAQPRPQVMLSGIGTAGGVCVDPGVAVWVTDRTPLDDRLQRVGADGSASSSPAWTWPERPGVGGCVAAGDVVAVSLSTGEGMAVLAADPDTGTVTTAPNVIAQDRYGQLGGAALGPDGIIWVSTVNKTAGEPGPTDDRVIKMPLPSGGGGFD
ncbi:PQQ-dependent sugar dehydrogenase [Rhodococcus sp. NPDC049939]|uniref:PQQ-dependent sugar dehydrogenase n=1 Tax=Rhodococcus sp. NPDC049939 TaxID=3155511 RepID=UPI0033E87A20